jgi:RNA polymerase sigma-70 factor (ECF subfamily)
MSFFRKKSDFNLEEVLAGCRQNKPKAQRQLVEQFFVQAKRICLRYAGNAQEAEEIADDGFIKIFANLQNFEPNRAFEPWLKTIMIRTAIDYFRKRQQVLPVAELDESYQAG